MNSFSVLLFSFLIVSCQSIIPEIQPFNAKVARENKLRSDFRAGNCSETIKNAELWLQQTVKSEINNTLSYNALAWLLITCPNSKYLNPKRSLELMSRVEKIKPLSIPQLDTLACAHAANGNFDEAIRIAQKNNLTDPVSKHEPRVVQFQRKNLCKWDETIVDMPSLPTAEQIAISNSNTEVYLGSLRETQMILTKKPIDVNAAILACEKNINSQNIYFCKQDLSNNLRKTTSDRFTECEKYENETKVAERCYKFYFENMGSGYLIGICKTEACRKNYCTYRKKECSVR